MLYMMMCSAIQNFEYDYPEKRQLYVCYYWKT